MRLFMCVNYPIDNPAIGISKKIRDQVEAFTKMGYEVYYTAYHEMGVAVFRRDEVVFYEELPKALPSSMRRVIRNHHLLMVARHYLESHKGSYEIGFVRWTAVSKEFLRTLEAMRSHCQTIMMDCHGYHSGWEATSLKGRYILSTTKANGRYLSRYVDVCLTESSLTEVFGVPALPMDTCIDINKYSPHLYEGDKHELNLISVAIEQEYHGIDRLVAGLACCNKKDVYLHLVGKYRKRTLRSIEKFGLNDKVIRYGYLSGRELEAVYKKCNVGVGPLAPHRNGGKEGTGIKTKEYFAIGMPYIYAGNELLVPDGYPYVLNVPSDDEPVSIGAVWDFYKGIRDDRDICEHMRAFAEQHYRWEKVFSDALALARLLT